MESSIISYRTHLHIRQTDVKHLVDVGKPNKTHISYDERAQIALIARQIPDARDCTVHLLLWKDF